jgi:hypothetical protein
VHEISSFLFPAGPGPLVRYEKARMRPSRVLMMSMTLFIKRAITFDLSRTESNAASAGSPPACRPWPYVWWVDAKMIEDLRLKSYIPTRGNRSRGLESPLSI